MVDSYWFLCCCCMCQEKVRYEVELYDGTEDEIALASLMIVPFDTLCGKAVNAPHVSGCSLLDQGMNAESMFLNPGQAMTFLESGLGPNGAPLRDPGWNPARPTASTPQPVVAQPMAIAQPQAGQPAFPGGATGV